MKCGTGIVRIGFHDNTAFDKRGPKSVWQVSGKVRFKGRCRMGTSTKIVCTGELTVGADFISTAQTSIYCAQQIEFGAGNLLAWDITVLDNDYHSVLDEQGEKINPARPVQDRRPRLDRRADHAAQRHPDRQRLHHRRRLAPASQVRGRRAADRRQSCACAQAGRIVARVTPGFDREKRKPRLLYLVAEDWYFCSHRLPLAVAARASGFEVTVATRVQQAWRSRSAMPVSRSSRSVSIDTATIRCASYARWRRSPAFIDACVPISRTTSRSSRCCTARSPRASRARRRWSTRSPVRVTW